MPIFGSILRLLGLALENRTTRRLLHIAIRAASAELTRRLEGHTRSKHGSAGLRRE